MKIYKKQFSAKDLLEVARDPGMRVSSTPFGSSPGERTMYIGKSVPWKGVRGIDNIRAINPRVAEGITNARAMSMRHHEKGIAWVQYPNSQVVGMPMKAYQMMIEAGHTVALVYSTNLAKRPWIVRRVPA